MHPVIAAVIAAHGTPESIAGQDPQLPESGEIARLAYWQSADKKDRNLRTVCPTARYIARLWSDLKDHQIRDYVAAHAAPAMVWATTTEDIVTAVTTGPNSCMSYPANRFECDGHHPYEVYDPGLGWSMALLYANNDTPDKPTSRALVYTAPTTGKRCYVRSYTHATTPPTPGAYSKPCPVLEAALSAAGVVRAKAWPEGAELEQISLGNGAWLMPYVDGERQGVISTGFETIEIVDTGSGDHEATETTGFVGAERCYCEHCDQYVNHDYEDMVVTAYEETVCPDCAEHDFTRARVYAYGSRMEVMVPNDEVVETTDGKSIREADASELGYVQIQSGDYAPEDECVELHDGDYALADECVELHDGTYALTEDCTHLHDGTYVLTEDCTELHDGTYALTEDCTELPDGYHRLTSAVQGYLPLSA